MSLTVQQDQWLELKKIANRLRQHIITSIYMAQSGHPGSSLSAVEILTALYFNNILHYNPKAPDWEERDCFILSKGHGCPLLYAVLAETGYISPELLPTLRKIDSPLEGHPDRRKVPGVEASTGSLGQGLSIGIGMALAARLKKKNSRVFVLLGDGEIEEGQIWEGALFAAHHHLNNLTAIIDYNKFQLDGPIKEILDLEPLKKKWEAFNWEVIEIDGHNFREITEALKASHPSKPIAIVAHTIKGKGISFMENNNHFHGVAPNSQEFEQAIKELKEEEEKLSLANP